MYNFTSREKRKTMVDDGKRLSMVIRYCLLDSSDWILDEMRKVLVLYAERKNNGKKLYISNRYAIINNFVSG